MGNDIEFQRREGSDLISIHVPAWGTTTTPEQHLQLFSYFNPRSRVGNDHHCIAVHPCIAISIHVPAWGTTIMTQIMESKMIFQSTFPRGERRDGGYTLTTYTSDFNPRSRVGNDKPCIVFSSNSINFNPRSRVGNDTKLRGFCSVWKISIHVPAWGTTYSLLT